MSEAIDVTCDSCSERFPHQSMDKTNCGCRKTICPACAAVFCHWGGGAHGLGNPRERMVTLTEGIKELIEAGNGLTAWIEYDEGEVDRWYRAVEGVE